jgi:hypothetical protein
LLGDRLKELDALKRKPPELVVFFWPFSESAEAFLSILPLRHVSWDSDRVPASQPCRGF